MSEAAEGQLKVFVVLAEIVNSFHSRVLALLIASMSYLVPSQLAGVEPVEVAPRYVVAIASCANGELWAGTDGDGLWRSSDGGATWIEDVEYRKKCGDCAFCLYVDSLGRLWSGSLTHGICVYDGRRGARTQENVASILHQLPRWCDEQRWRGRQKMGALAIHKQSKHSVVA